MSLMWVAVILAVGTLFAVYFFLQSLRAEGEIKQCHYSKALQALDRSLGLSSISLFRLLRADALFFSGRPVEAEVILREYVQPSHDAADWLMASERLGRVLLAQDRYAEAREAFQTAADLKPTRSAAYSGFCELRLRQGIDPAAALADAERALQNHYSALTETATRERIASIRGNQAWALALLGRGEESRDAIKRGTLETDPKHKPEFAGLDWRAGMAMLAIADTTAAAAHFRRALNFDPDGYYGGLARRQLTQHGL